jgi:hypothetical protein
MVTSLPAFQPASVQGSLQAKTKLSLLPFVSVAVKVVLYVRTPVSLTTQEPSQTSRPPVAAEAELRPAVPSVSA